MQEEVRGGLGPGHVPGAEDASLEVLVESGRAQVAGYLLVAAVGGEADGERALLERLGDPVHGRQLRVVRLLVPPLVRLPPARLQLPSEPLLHRADELALRRPQEPLDDLLLREGAPEVRQHPGVHPDGDPLAVHQHPVAVEDDEVKRFMRHARKPTAHLPAELDVLIPISGQGVTPGRSLP
ncbi:hypothetical protein GCM10010357_70350 [Streptomyces luteireticuli]|uniref:Uncharacterized protein n=1 Tax=Streptomyces luteireticuli TaxID=173858 RepID=A0ABN0Z9R1_9ACTN